MPVWVKLMKRNPIPYAEKRHFENGYRPETKERLKKEYLCHLTVIPLIKIKLIFYEIYEPNY